MKPPVETVRISQRGKEILINAKRRTGIEQWNVLCRWALSASLAVESCPKPERATEDSNIEIAWKVFGGTQADILAAMLKTRHHLESKRAETTEADYLRAHLERGIGYLQGVKSLDQLFGWNSDFAG